MSFAGEPEQRQLGANGVDVIDEFCEASIFDDAARYLTKSSLKLSNAQKLTFYALFKQATVGPCNTPKPSLLSMYERTKWNAWNDLNRMSKDEAIARYVAELDKVSPAWRDSGVEGDSDSADDEEAESKGKSKSKKKQSGGGGGGGGSDGLMTQPQSRPIPEAEEPESALSAAQKDVFFHAKLGHLSQVSQCIKAGQNVNARDSEGRTALHWAVDRAHESLVHALVEQHAANANVQDGEGATPLHYAALCEHLPLTLYLLQHGADPQIEDESGESAGAAVRELKGVTSEMLQLLDAAKPKSD